MTSCRTYVPYCVALVLVGVISGTVQADLTTGLEAHYPLNGNAEDSSGNGYDGTVHGAIPTTDRFGNANAAIYFDGSDDYVSTGFGNSVTYPHGFTIQAWVKPADTGDGKGGLVISRGNVAGDAHSEFIGLYAVGPRGLATMFLYANDPSTHTGAYSDTSLNDHEWHHVVGTYDGSTTLSVYVDGVDVASVPASGTFYSADVFKIGWDDWRSDESGRWFTGSVDDVRIWSRALSEPEIQSLVPEPATIALLAIGGLAIIRRKRQ